MVWSSETTFCTIVLDYDKDKQRLGCIDTATSNVNMVSPEFANVQELVGLYEDAFVLKLAYPTSLDRSIWVLELDGTTRQLSPEASGMYDINLSNDGKKYFLQYHGNGFSTLPFTQYADGTKVTAVETNQNLRWKLDTHNTPVKKFETLVINGFPLNTVMIFPSNFTQGLEYDVLVNVYGGPGSQEVSRAYSYSFNEYLVSAKNYIVAIVDGRGTGGQGLKFLMNYTYGKLGITEISDQIAYAKYLRTLPYVRTVSIWGWSFGGFMTSMAVTDPNSVYDACISVAPVTDWRLYDSVYTERYMNTPQNNMEGYNKSSILQRNIQLINNRPYLLVHGLADDNVHFANSAVLDLELVSNDIAFTTMYYTNSNHNINYKQSRKHLYKLIERFLEENLPQRQGPN